MFLINSSSDCFALRARNDVLGECLWFFPTNNDLVHLDIGKFLCERFYANLLGGCDTCLVGVRVLRKESVVVTLSMSASFAGQVELGAGDQEYRKVALVGGKVSVWLHDTELSLDQILL